VAGLQAILDHRKIARLEDMQRQPRTRQHKRPRQGKTAMVSGRSAAFIMGVI
jgi:hypothetical protein